MSEQSSKLKCAFCNAYLFEDDDVVYCPVCGAPHHRACYEKNGKCALEDLHGTENEYKKEEIEEITDTPVQNTLSLGANEIKCGMCGTVYERDENACPECGTPNLARVGRQRVQYDFLGGVPGDMDLGEGVTADEAKHFVFANTARYIPKFAANKMGKKASWNWLAFLLPCPWFFSRKMYKLGAFIGAISVALDLFLFPAQKALNAFLPETMATYDEMFGIVTDNIGKIGKPAIILAAAAIILNIVLRIICGIFGDLFYRNHTISTLKTLKTESEDLEEDMHKKGGVNFIMFVLGLVIVYELPTMLLMFFGV